MHEKVLAGLDNTDPALAALFWEVIFIFKDVAKRIDPKDFAKALRPISQKNFFFALGFATMAGFEEALVFLLHNMTARVAHLLSEEMEGLNYI